MSGIKSIEATLVETGCANRLGECPLWDEQTQCVMWVDIDGKTFWTYHEETHTTKSYELPERAGNFCLVEGSDTLLFGFETGLAFYDPKVGAASLRKVGPYVNAPFEADVPKSRINDGRVDPNGRFVFGGYNETGVWPSAPESAIYRYDGVTDTVEKLVANVACSNSICFPSMDGSDMCFTDSQWMDGRIVKTSTYGNGKAIRVEEDCETVVHVGGQHPFADGAVVDSDGNIWGALLGGGKVVRYGGANGEIDFEVTIPVPFATCLTFGGKDLRTLYITNAGKKVPVTDIDAHAKGYAGGLFTCELPSDMPCGRLETRLRVA